MKKSGTEQRLATTTHLRESGGPQDHIVSTIKPIRIEYDDAKSARNAHDRGLPFSMAHQFNFSTAHYEVDARNPYPETRYVALGYLGERLHVLCSMHITGGNRVISFRKANQRERMAYEKARSFD